MTVTLYDAAYPNPAVDPHDAGCLVYIGGDTPHVWSDAEIKAAWGRYRVPTYVRSNPQNADPIGDAGQALAWLAAHRVPAGRVVVLDLETAVDAVYVLAFGNRMHQAGYLVWVYGSKSTLFKNPALDGYFVADYTQTEHQYAGAVTTQWADGPYFDLDDTDAVGVLWDYAPPPTTTIIPEEEEMAVTLYQNESDGAVIAIDGAYRFLVTSVADHTAFTNAGAKTVLVSPAQFETVLGAVVPAAGGPAASALPKTFTVTAQ